MKPPADQFEKIVRAIVEGQIRGFAKEHPVVIEAVDWYKPRRDKATTFTNSLSKRIIRDLTCPTSRARLEAALSQCSGGVSPVRRRGFYGQLRRWAAGLAFPGPAASRTDSPNAQSAKSVEK